MTPRCGGSGVKPWPIAALTKQAVDQCWQRSIYRLVHVYIASYGKSPSLRTVNQLFLWAMASIAICYKLPEGNITQNRQSSMAPGFLPASRSSQGVHRFTGRFICFLRSKTCFGWDGTSMMGLVFIFHFIYGIILSYFSRWLLHHQPV